ncbi:amidase [Cohnella zeiphila]|uniref:Aspartyl/glutamyl-tRNA amidotransferase subunit A n=1 Tax=Cohnella zeiphila TaxID=2761120 RepID=A0A7X0VZ63_9BACL|nr:amidase [Cohnella zeiphila]MBB6735400.1 aspartyl/glutamyl-tRNA amidotransferase subunit A [Cohnella zeiphila]
MKTMHPELTYATIHELSGRIRSREISPVELAEQAVARIEQVNPSLNAFVTVTAELAMEQAKQAEQELMKGNYKGPLHGIPIVHKDLYYTKGIRTTASSKILKDFVPDYDSTAVAKLAEAGTVLLGKVQTHEFASGTTTNSVHFGPCRNPWNLERVPGGSSGGTGAAVASGIAYMGTGSDTGGSIRIPAACCGVVGMKPTYGRVSRYGIVPMGWSLDHAGPLTRSVLDASLSLDAMSGFDPKDESTVNLPAPGLKMEYAESLKGVRIGIPTRYYYDNVEADVLTAVQAAIAKFKELGAEVVEVELSKIGYARSAASAILMGELVAYHEPWLESRPEDYGADVRMMLESGRNLPASTYLQAQRARHLVVQDFLDALSGVDVLLTPATPLTAPTAEDFSRTLRLAEFTMPTNLTGLPSLSMPCGFSPEGMPVNLQLIGRPFDEATVLGIGYGYECNTEWHLRHPEL